MLLDDKLNICLDKIQDLITEFRETKPDLKII
jgi:hypothetical protein